MSHPLWVCGLKLRPSSRYHPRAEQVTPFMGVWIEITIAGSEDKVTVVTPFMGVWIEIWKNSSRLDVP